MPNLQLLSDQILNDPHLPTIPGSYDMLYDSSWFREGHYYRWTAPIGKLPNSSEQMHRIYDHPIVFCTAVGGQVTFDVIESSWCWGHLVCYFEDLGTTYNPREGDPSVPTLADPPKKGDILSILIPNFTKPLSVVVMDNRQKAPHRLVMVNGQSAMVDSRLLRRR